MTAVPKQIPLVLDAGETEQPATIDRATVEAAKRQRGPLIPRDIVKEFRIVRLVK